jgi:WD40 repeat protein
VSEWRISGTIPAQPDTTTNSPWTPPSGLFAFADYYSRSVLVFSTTESSKSTVVPFDSEALAISFSGDGNRLAIMEKSLIRVYDTSSGMPEGLALQNVLTRPQYDATQFDSMAFSADGATLAVATTAKPSGYLFELVIFDLNSGEPVRMTRMTNQGNQLQYSPDGERLLVTGLDRSWFVTIRDAQTLNVIARFATSGEDTTFDGTGDLVLAYSTGDSIPLDAYDWRTGLRVFRDYPLYRYDVSFHDVRAAAGSDSVYACTSNAIYRLKLPDACDSGGSAPLRKLLGIDQACEPKDLNSDGVLDTADFVAWSLAP